MASFARTIDIPSIFNAIIHFQAAIEMAIAQLEGTDAPIQCNYKRPFLFRFDSIGLCDKCAFRR